MKKLLTVCLLAILYVTSAFAQSTVTVTVKDDVGAVPGASVLIKGTTTGEMTDIDGVAKLTAKDTDVLVISFIGYRTVEVTVGTRSKIDVTLEVDSEQLEETVVVGYGQQKKTSLTSAIATVKSEDITSTKQTNLVASLQGKVPGLQIRQRSGKPGTFDTDLSLRGFGQPLVIIDGVARTAQARNGEWGYWMDEGGAAALSQLNPEDIESISVLKDASAAIYGLEAANGVILVTTKKGQIGKPSVNYSNNFSFGVPTARPQAVDLVTYMRLENEMRLNSKQGAKYSEEFIAHYENGDEGYIETDWFDVVMKDYSFNMTHNLSVRGGNQQTQYYLSGNYSEDNSILTMDNMNNDRLSFTGNVTSKVTNELSVSFQTALSYSNIEGMPGVTNQNIWYYTSNADRTIPAKVITNPEHYSALPDSENRNPLAITDRDAVGYQDNKNLSFRNNLDVRYEPKWLKGLQISASGAYDFSSYRQEGLNKLLYLYDYQTDVQAGANAEANEYSESWSTRQMLYGRVQANFNRRFGDHNVGATLAGEVTKNLSHSINGGRKYGDFFTHNILGAGDASTATNGGSRSDNAKAGYVVRASYDYKGKYLVDFSGRYDGTYVYAPGYRWGFFPAYSVGYRISEEPWFKKAMPWFNNLKFRWSDGLMGSVQGSAYAWQLGYTSSGSYVFEDGQLLNGYVSHSTAETLLSWADVRSMDFGIDWDMWRGKFGGSIDWFWRRTSGIAARSTTTVPDFYGLSLPQQNLNASENVGIDLQLSHQNNIGEFWYRIAATGTFSRFHTTYQETDKTAIYSSSQNYWSNHSTGRWSNARSGQTYLWEDGSQFQNWDEITSHPVYHGSTENMLPGMYKIKDRDGNGLINGTDRYYVWGQGNAPLQFGLIFSGRYKGFDLNLNFAGSTLVHKSASLSGAYGWGFFPTFYEHNMDHYTLAEGFTDPMNPNSEWTAGYFPAIAKATSGGDGSSNGTYRVAQPYNFVNATFFRLKSAELGYTLPAKWTNAIKIKSLRIYVSGTNLLTFCNKLLKPYDPERNDSGYMNAGGYPLMKTFSCGLNLNF